MATQNQPRVSIIGLPNTPIVEGSGESEVFTIKFSEPAPAGGFKLNVIFLDSDGMGAMR